MNVINTTQSVASATIPVQTFSPFITGTEVENIYLNLMDTFAKVTPRGELYEILRPIYRLAINDRRMTAVQCISVEGQYRQYLRAGGELDE